MCTIPPLYLFATRGLLEVFVTDARMRLITLLICALVLAVGTLSLLTGETHSGSVQPGPEYRLKDMLPPVVPGWTSHNEPLGPTELTTTRIREMLNFDDLFYRSYTCGPRSLTIYVGYWGRAKMPVDIVGGHLPDGCWTSAGWSIVAIDENHKLRAGNFDLIPGRWRQMKFEPSGVLAYVEFWHLVNRNTYMDQRPGTGFGLPYHIRYWARELQRTFGRPSLYKESSPEQYFIRISSNVPFEGLRQDPGFVELATALGKLGLATSLQKAGE